MAGAGHYIKSGQRWEVQRLLGHVIDLKNRVLACAVFRLRPIGTILRILKRSQNV